MGKCEENSQIVFIPCGRYTMSKPCKEVFMKKITENVYVLTGSRGCNPGYVVTSEGVVLIDTPQLPTKAVAMREEILRKGPLRFLINTEYHLDHIFGNHYFAGLCPVVSHRHTLESFWSFRPGVDAYDYMVDLVKNDDPQGVKLMPSRKDLTVNAPTVTFSDNLTLRVGEHVFELIHTPGHTKGQIAVFVPKEKVVFVGDTVFCERQVWFHSADPDRWLDSLDFLETLEVDHIVPGHGPICDKAYLLKQSAYLREWITAVAVGIANGWSKEECVRGISFLDRLPMDTGHENSGPMVQQWNIERIFDYLLGRIKRF